MQKIYGSILAFFLYLLLLSAKLIDMLRTGGENNNS